MIYSTPQEAMVADLNKQMEMIDVLRKQLDIANEAIDTIINPDSPFASSKYIAREAKAEINRLGGVK